MRARTSGSRNTLRITAHLWARCSGSRHRLPMGARAPKRAAFASWLERERENYFARLVGGGGVAAAMMAKVAASAHPEVGHETECCRTDLMFGCSSRRHERCV